MTCLRERTKFLALVLGAASVAAWSTAALAETVKVRNIRVSETSGDTAVVIGASARPTFTTWKLEQPSRVVVELSGARLGDVDVPLDAGTYAVGLVSASVTEDDSAGPRTRIVLTLRQASDYRVETRGSDITLRVIPHVRPPVAAATAQNAAAAMRAEAKAKDDAEAKARAEATAKAEAQARAEAEAQAKTLAAANAKAEAQAKHEALAKTEAQAQAKQEAQAKTEAQAQAKVEAQAKREAQAEARAEANARAQAQGRADQQARLAALAKAEAEAHAKAQAKAEAQLKDEARQRQAAQAMAEEKSRSEAAARSETERLRKELAAAQKQTELARAEASAATAESHRQSVALAQAESLIKQAQAEVERSRKQTALAESETLQAKQRERERDKAVKAAIAQVEARQKALDAMARSQEEQRSKLAAAEQLVGARQTSLRASESELAAREQESRQARARRDALASDASKQSKAEAAAVLAAAESQRRDAAKAASESRAELAAAIASRKQEEMRKEQQAQARKAEEEKLAAAIALRKSEEARLTETGAERSRMETERARLQKEQAQLEASRQALLAEVKRLKDATTLASQAAAAAPKPTAPAVAQPQHASTAPMPAVVARQMTEATKAVPATVTARSRSITLRALSQVRSIDFVDEPARASVIIDVDDNASFTIERMAGRRLSLRLDHSDLPDSLARNLDATEYLGPVKIISSYRDPAARTTVRIDVDLAEEVPNRVRLDGNRIYWDFQKAQGKSPSLPANVVRPPAVLFVPARKVAGFFATVADSAWLGQVTPPPYLVPPGSAPAAPAASAPAAPPAAGPGATPSAPGAGGRYATLGKKRYTGRRIDLDFKGADIHNILRLLADVGQVNVVVADDVRGDVTIKMRDVPWDQALDVVLRSKGLGSVREGNLLRVAPLALLEKELEAEIARQKQIAEVVPVETRLIGVSYAEASELMEKARDLLSPRGKISQDHRTNTMIVSDVSKNLQLIEDLVRNLDTQTSQVTIEARIVEANSNFSRQIGVQWGGTGYMDSAHGNPTGLTFPYNVGIGGGADDSSSPVGGLVPGARTGTGTTGSPNFLVNMPAPAGLGTGSAIGLTLGSVAGAFNLNLRLSAMETTGQVRILSSPRITTMDNVEAQISQGVSIPVSVVSAMGAQTQFVDARLTLSVKPHVTNEGTIAMVINVTRNEPDFVNTGARGDPSIQKKEARTSMLVRDGDTAVIGGIYTRNTGLSNARVPFFSDIPVLGWFFRNKKENDNRSEFLVFITPRIANRARALGQ
jgi:type IV pilus assembly protein PilQ